jgi:hypothetical protein
VLQKLMERSVILAAGEAINFAIPKLGRTAFPPEAAKPNSSASVERDTLLRALKNTSRAVPAPSGAHPVLT